MSKIIAFSGKKQSGKTTAVEDLFKMFDEEGAWILNFADFLKHIVAKCFVGSMFFEEGHKQEVFHGKTGREWLQIVGTDWFRKHNPECWVNAYKSSLDETDGDLILTADVRFPNEVKCIQDLGGHVIRLLRNPHDDQHESETVLDGVEFDTAYSLRADMSINEPLPKGTLLFDAEIDNRNMSIEEQNEAVWKLVNERKWL